MISNEAIDDGIRLLKESAPIDLTRAQLGELSASEVSAVLWLVGSGGELLAELKAAREALAFSPMSPERKAHIASVARAVVHGLDSEAPELAMVTLEMLVQIDDLDRARQDAERRANAEYQIRMERDVEIARLRYALEQTGAAHAI